jgi:hypothetical protein
MRFGRVEGFIQPLDNGRVRLIVTLETGAGIVTARDEILDPPSALKAEDLFWLADQYTQETIGHHLAEEGWEPIGAGEPPNHQVEGPPKSATYAVRNLIQG